jgi:ankyrin repeat protein
MDARYLQLHSQHQHHEFTNNWTAKEVITRWIDSSSSLEVSQILLLTGKAGSGKSVLLFFAYQEAVSRPTDTKRLTVNLTYFFDATKSESDKTFNSPTALLQSFLYQILEAIDTMLTPSWKSKLAQRLEQCLAALKRTKQNENQPSDSEQSVWASAMEDCMKNLLEGLSTECALDGVKIRIFIDALDECGHETATVVREFLERTTIAWKTPKTSIHLCISYRSGYNGLQGSWNEADYAVSLIELNAHNKEIIRAYVRRKLERYHSVDIDALVEKASGVFLWVKLVVKAIVEADPDQCDPAVLNEIIHEMPRDLDSVYMRMLDHRREMASHIEIAETIAILQIVLYGQKAFAISELRAALLLQDVKCKVENPQHFMSRIEHASRGLVEFHKADDEEPTVRLIHDTARSFLLGKSGLEALIKLQPNLPPDDFEGHSHLALLRLCMIVFDKDDSDDKVTELRKYAVSAWLYHARCCNEHLQLRCQTHANHELKLIARCENKANRLYNDCRETFRGTHHWHWVSELESVLTLMAMSGCLCLLELHTNAKCICREGDPRCVRMSKSVNNATLLHAARGGHTDIVRFCLTQDVDINFQRPPYNQTPLFVACSMGHDQTVRLILKEGGYPSLYKQSKCENTYAFLEAAARGQRGVLEEIFNFLSSNTLNLCELFELKAGSLGYTALHLATRFNRADTVIYLVDVMNSNNMDLSITTFPNSKHPHSGLTALELAHKMNCSTAIMDILERYG